MIFRYFIYLFYLNNFLRFSLFAIVEFLSSHGLHIVLQFDILKNILILVFHCVQSFNISLYLLKYQKQDFCQLISSFQYKINFILFILLVMVKKYFDFDHILKNYSTGYHHLIIQLIVKNDHSLKFFNELTNLVKWILIILP